MLRTERVLGSLGWGRSIVCAAVSPRPELSVFVRSRTTVPDLDIFVVRETVCVCMFFLSPDVVTGLRVVDTFCAAFRRVPARATSAASSATAP